MMKNLFPSESTEVYMIFQVVSATMYSTVQFYARYELAPGH